MQSAAGQLGSVGSRSAAAAKSPRPWAGWERQQRLELRRSGNSTGAACCLLQRGWRLGSAREVKTIPPCPSGGLDFHCEKRRLGREISDRSAALPQFHGRWGERVTVTYLLAPPSEPRLSVCHSLASLYSAPRPPSASCWGFICITYRAAFKSG